MKKLPILVALLMSGLTVLHAEDRLKTDFAKPPASARPWVMYFALNGNLTKEGITADLEGMARVGIGGLIYFEVDWGAPKGPANFAGPLWMELFKHVCNEAHRLGLQINMNNDAGWCGSGGPWITPELSMQKVVWSETRVEGGKKFDGPLAKPEAVMNYYQDIAVLAFPTPPVETVKMQEATPKFGSSGTNSRPGQFTLARYRIEDISHKTSLQTLHLQHEMPPAPANWPVVQVEAVIPGDRIVDLTGVMDATGKLTYDFPAGNWTILRFGHTTTGQKNSPPPDSGRGLECDKFSKEAAKVAFNGLMSRLVTENKTLAGQDKTLVSTHIDSWEVGGQNWTPLMREEFKKRRGYDLWKYLPAFTGCIVDNVEVTERFLWDLRQTVSDLIVKNYAGEFRRLANQHGLRLSIEAYQAPIDELAYGGQADEPMAEFWAWPKFNAGTDSCTKMASSAHTYGKKILGAEAFTSHAMEKWQSHPGNMKDLGDWAFCEGINRFVFHRYAAQPWTHVVPGMSMGPFGVHYERTQTWWEQSKAWHEYLTRCQYLLQQGLFVADVAYLQPEGAPRAFTPPAGAKIAPHIRSGYNFDGCTPEVVTERMSVKNGRIVLPDGMSYAVLVVPEVETMTPKLLRKISQLANQGATVIAGVKPPQKSPSLADLGQGDAEVKKLADELWGSGKIIAGKTAAEVLSARGLKPDFSATPMLRYIHHTLDDAEVYFVANPEPKEVAATAAFRITGKRPEFWWPDTGRTEPVNDFEIKDGITRIPLRLDPSGSVFVVFKERSQNSGVRIQNRGVNFPEFKPVQEITGPWEIAFDPKWGGPEKAAFDKLEDWSKRPEAGIKYYSGTAIYRKTFQFEKGEHPTPVNQEPSTNNQQRLFLDLGKVAVMAQVTLNGKDLGILWKPPFRVEVTAAIQPGENKLEVKVVNLLINRQIGDEQLPEDSERNPGGTLKSWPQWVQEGRPSPTGRFTFGSHRLWKKDDPLVESGLLGPVTIQVTEVIK